MDEKHALGAMKRGSEAALEWFIRRYAPYVSAVILNVSGGVLSPEDREEICSDVFLALWNGAGKVRPGKAKAYLGAVARNLTKNRLRSRGQEMPLEEDVLEVSPADIHRQLEAREQARIVGRAVTKMPPPDREIFLRHYYYGQPLSRIAEEMNMNLSTVKTRLRRGREKLKDELRKGGYDVADKYI